MRLAVLGLSHETNTFSRVPADYAQFVSSGILRGDEIAGATPPPPAPWPASSPPVSWRG